MSILIFIIISILIVAGCGCFAVAKKTAREIKHYERELQEIRTMKKEIEQRIERRAAEIAKAQSFVTALVKFLSELKESRRHERKNV